MFGSVQPSPAALTRAAFRFSNLAQRKKDTTLGVVKHKSSGGAGENEASLRDMMHLLRKYDVAHFIRNDAMFAKNISEATSFTK